MQNTHSHAPQASPPRFALRWLLLNGAFLMALVLIMGWAMNSGSDTTALSDLWRAPDDKARAILFLARLPRVLLAAAVGMALATSGASFQALLKNPLADPFILGISGGAALGSVIAIGLHVPFALAPVLAFSGSILATLLLFWLSSGSERLDPMRLLLTGVVFNAFCFALILFINAVVTMEQAYQIIFLLIGNLDVTDLRTVGIVWGFVATGFLTTVLCAGKLNLLSVGDDDARTLGVSVKGAQVVVFVAGALMVGSAVAVSGLIGFVGLFIPHLIRLTIGPDHRLLLPLSGLAGAAFLVLADTLARTVLMKTGLATELPVGVITAMIGAPLFLWFLRPRRNS